MSDKKHIQKLKTVDFISIFFRSFFIQAVWNYKGLISIGICYALIPVARRICKTKTERASFMKRHLDFFNTHPYFSSYALGAISRIEEDNIEADSCITDRIEKFKNALIGPLGAVGDQLFWASIKPASVLFGFVGVTLASTIEIKLLFLGLFLILYNIPHIYTRYTGLKDGYSFGFNVYKLIRIENFIKINTFYQVIGAAALGLFTGYALASSANENILNLLVFSASAGGAYTLRNKRRKIYLPIILPMALTLILGIIVTKL